MMNQELCFVGLIYQLKVKPINLWLNLKMITIC